MFLIIKTNILTVISFVATNIDDLVIRKYRNGYLSGLYYVTTLMGLEETYAVLIIAISIAGSLLMYLRINKFAKKKEKSFLYTRLYCVCFICFFSFCGT